MGPLPSLNIAMNNASKDTPGPEKTHVSWWLHYYEELTSHLMPGMRSTMLVCMQGKDEKCVNFGHKPTVSDFQMAVQP